MKTINFKLKPYLTRSRWDIDEISMIKVNDKLVRSYDGEFKRVISRLSKGIKAISVTDTFSIYDYPSHSCRITVEGLKTRYIICRKRD